ncbi:MAG: nuclear transport factor 2 family protein [Actinomycetes bacterium]
MSDRDVLAAAADLVSAFGRSDLPAYFGAFAEDASFVFHTSPDVLGSLEAYRREWDRWTREDGLRIVSCTSQDPRVQVLGRVAVFTHRVRARVATNSGEQDLRERETIVFRRDGDLWLAVHEHLSPDPGSD